MSDEGVPVKVGDPLGRSAASRRDPGRRRAHRAGEAMIGNFDWCLKFAPDGIYRCNEPKPLWNILA